MLLSAFEGAEPGGSWEAACRRAAGGRFGAAERRHDAAARLTLLGDLRRALDDPGQLTLHYQPQIAVDSDDLVGIEALARWQHPTRGPVPPAEFIPVLEVSSLMHRFTEQMLGLALRQGRAWLDAGHSVPISVNVSTRSLLNPAFPERVAALLAESGMPGSLLCVEVTEYALMNDPDTAIAALRRLRDLGVTASIDDYGTGFSSMTYLKLLPVGELKIDQSFVRDVATDNSNRALVASTVELGHSLGLSVVAEGVEDAESLAVLRAMGCDTAQGLPLRQAHAGRGADRPAGGQPSTRHDRLIPRTPSGFTHGRLSRCRDAAGRHSRRW